MSAHIQEHLQADSTISVASSVQFVITESDETLVHGNVVRKKSINMFGSIGGGSSRLSGDGSNLEESTSTSEARRPRNKSFCKAKVISKRQQIRDKFKNEFFSGMKGALSSEKRSVVEEEESKGSQVEVSQFESTDGNSSENTLVNATTAADGESVEVAAFTEEDIIQPVFLRVPSKENNDGEIEADRKENIFHIIRGSRAKSGSYQSFEEIYTLTDVLGEGCVGLVKKATKIADGSEYAVKIVRTRDEETILNIRNEFLHLRKLDHKNIVKVNEIYIDKAKGKIYTVMELIDGREMFEVINQLGSYSEEKARKIFKQIIEAIQYMHSHFVCHRDLKPNNILCDESGDHVKITDFNVSKFSDSYKDYSKAKSSDSSSIKMWTYTGTIAFSAPEIFNENCYDENIDVWSAGVILYTMLCGKEPFQAEFVQDLIAKIVKGEYSFPSDPWDRISANAKDLIQRCLTVNPEERIKPDMMAIHPWIEETCGEMKSQELDRNKLVQNLDRLVKGRKDSFEVKEVRTYRSQTLSYPAASYFKTNDFMFSNKCFGNPTHSEEEEDHTDDVESSFYVGGEASSCRAARMTVADLPLSEVRPRSRVLQIQPFSLQSNVKSKMVNFAVDELSKEQDLTIFSKRPFSKSIDADLL